jgi:adenosine deaminase
MKSALFRGAFLVAVLTGAWACGGDATGSTSSTGTTSSGGSSSSSGTTTASAGGGGTGGAGTGGSAAGGAGTGGSATGGGGTASCGTPTECAATWEQAASDKLDGLAAGPPDALAAFLKAMPKGGDLHNHLSGAIYAETYLGWAKADGDCVNSSTYAAVFSGQCSASTQPAPTAGAFFDSIVHAWSMKDFVAGAETGHDHFFATFGKYGAVAGAHRDDSLADVATRAADENELYVETMFNLGKNLGALSASIWSGALTATDLPGLYASILAAPTFSAELASDVQVVTSARSAYRTALGCDDLSPPPACDVEVRFIAQVSRTGAKDTVFGQLIAAYEMASKTSGIVALNLSSPEDDPTSLANYDLHMAMLDFLYNQYTVTQKSPLHVTLHAGELTPEFLPPAYATANTFHIRKAVEIGHAERIGHGLDILSETNAQGLLDELHQKNVLVEVCLSSNTQILNVQGTAHPLATYLQNQVPVALATDDQGVSRSSLAGELVRGVVDQKLGYRQLKAMARDSLEHAFLPGPSLWSAIAGVTPVPDCAPTATMGLGDVPDATCQAFLATSERATMQWKLEHAFTQFESQQ